MAPGRIDIGVVRAVSWDVDGTLYSTRRASARLRLGLVSAAIRGRARESWRAGVALRAFRRGMERARSEGGTVPRDDEGIQWRLGLERDWLLPAIRGAGARPGVQAALRFLQTRVEAQVALSDFECGAKIACLGLADCFDATYSGERMGHIKPNPEPFRRILRDFDLPPECLLHIGDRPETDGAGAEAAGCAALVLGRDFRSFREVAAVFETKAAARRGPLRSADPSQGPTRR